MRRIYEYNDWDVRYAFSKTMPNFLLKNVPADLYFIALVPPAQVRDKVCTLKLEIKQRFGSGQALKSPAHITLQMPFRLPKEELEKLEDTLGNFSVTQNPFEITLEGFGCFAPRVIFIRIRDHGTVKSLEKRLKAVITERFSLNQRDNSLPFHPHMTIATRDLEEADFREAWEVFRNRAFARKIKVSSLFLLKHNGRRWEIYKEFEFKIRKHGYY